MNWFKGSLAVGAMAASLLFSGCQQPVNVTKSSSSGSLALSTDDAYLYAVDSDNGTLTVLDTKTEAKVATIKVGEQPQRVVVGSDDTIYVSNKGSNTVSVIRKGDWKTAATLNVGTEPTSLAVSPDNKRLYVVNSTGIDNAEFGTLTAIDTATLQPAFEVNVGAEPRGLALLGNDKAVVSLFKEGELVEVDTKAGTVTSGGIGIHAAANASGSSLTSSTFKPRGINDVVATPDGTRIFAPVIWAREDAIKTQPNSFGGYYARGGPCNVGGVASAGLVIADQGTNGGSLQPQVDDLTSCQSSGTNSEDKDYPATILGGAPTGSYTGSGQETKYQFQGPVAAAVDPTGSWVYLVNKETSSVAVIPAFRRSGEDIDFKRTGTSVRAEILLNNPADKTASSGPDGIALTRDGNKAYVYNQFDHRVDVVEGKDVNGIRKLDKTKGIVIAGDTLAPEAVAGRKLFFNARDPRISAANVTVSCATCHLEAGDDAHVWSFPDGPRQTPALAGRHVKETGPYHWSGEFSDTNKFMRHTIVERMGGTGLDTEKDMQNIMDYIDSVPAPQNANLKLVRTEAQLRGAQVFQKANCGSCHAGALLTDKKSHDVGTLDIAGVNGARISDNGLPLKQVLDPVTNKYVNQGLDAPSLLGLARSAPYLHDGSAYSLEDRVKQKDNLHGNLADLTDAQRSDLVQYLKTL